jgi:glycine dehydrogenase subunit 1
MNYHEKLRSTTKPIVYPYIPNSVPEVKKAILKEAGFKDIDEIYRDIPKKLKLNRKLNLPSPKSEYEVRRNIEAILAKNKTCNELLSFLGAGCWPHYIPAVCDEINARSEFVTTYGSPPQLSPGLYQTLFEYQSMICELVGMDATAGPMYDWATCCGEAANMAYRITGRNEVLVPRTINPERLSVMKNYSESFVNINLIDYDHETGQLDLEDLKKKISSKTAGVYFENPSYLGFIENQGEEIAKITHDKGALSIVGVEPSSLGILTPPGEYGADIVVGEGQPLGLHMNYGGAVLGLFAFPDDPKFVAEAPRRTNTLTTSNVEGVWGYVPVHVERDMYVAREQGTSFTGTTTVLWAITAAVYLALMGPQGMRDLGETIMQRSHYAMKLISEIKGVRAPIFDSTHFEEFTVNFDDTGKTVHDVNEALLKHGIQGGKDITKEFPELGKSALYCVTEIHMKEDIEKLINVFREVFE